MAAALFLFVAVDANGSPLSGAKLTTKIAGTSTDQPVYTTAALTTPETNPVIANSAGVFKVYLNTALSYDLSITNSAGSYTVAQATYTSGDADPLVFTQLPQSAYDANVQLILDIYEDIQTVAANDTDISVLADNIAAILTVAGAIDSGDIADIIAGLDAKLDITAGITTGTYTEMRALSVSVAATMGGFDVTGYGGGRFVWQAGDQSTLVDLDEMTTAEGDGRLYATPTADKTGASGCWKRDDYLAGLPIFLKWWAPLTDETEDVAPKMLKACQALERLTHFNDGTTATYGGELIVGPGKFLYETKVDWNPSVEVRFCVSGSGMGVTINLGDAANSDGIWEFDTRNVGVRASRKQVRDMSFRTYAAGGGCALRIPEIEGGGGAKESSVQLSNIHVESVAPATDYFDVGIDVSGNSRIIATDVTISGMTFTGTPGTDAADNNTGFAMSTGMITDGCYGAVLTRVKADRCALGFRNHGRRSEDASGVRQGYGDILGSNNNGGFLRLIVDTADHGFAVSDTIRLSAGSTYQTKSATITDVTGTSITTDIVHAGNIDTAERNWMAKFVAGGEGYQLINCSSVGSIVGCSFRLPGREASAIQTYKCHWNSRDIGIEIDGGKQCTFLDDLIYNAYYSAADSAALFIAYDATNVEEVEFVRPKLRFNTHPSRTNIRVKNGPDTGSSIRIIQPEVWDEADLCFDIQDTFDDVVIESPDFTGLASGDVAWKFSSGVTSARVLDYKLPTGATYTDNTTRGAHMRSWQGQIGNPDQLVTLTADGALALPKGFGHYVRVAGNFNINAGITLPSGFTPYPGYELVVQRWQAAGSTTVTSGGNLKMGSLSPLTFTHEDTLKLAYRNGNWYATSYIDI